MTKTANKNQYSNRVRRAEQCWLLANIKDLVDYNSEESPKKTGKHAFNTHHISLGNATSMEEILGKHFIGDEVAALFQISTEQLSALIPKIRIFRVDLEKNGKVKKGSTKEFFFPQHVEKKEVNEMLTGRSDRFGEAGIKSVSWNLLGGTPADATRYVQVTMDFLFSSIQTLAQIPYATGDKKANDVSYFDLFRRIGNNSYRLRLDVGWSIPPQKMHLFQKGDGPDVLKALKKINKTLWLHLKDHELNFRQDGSVEVKIEYISSLEYDLSNISVIKDTTVNITSPKARKEKKEKLSTILAEYSSKCKITAKNHKAMTGYDPTIDKNARNMFTSFFMGYKLINEDVKQYNQNVKKMRQQLKKIEVANSQAGMRILRLINKNLQTPVSVTKGAVRTRSFSVSVDPVELGYVDGSYDTDLNFTNRKQKIANIQSYREYKNSNQDKGQRYSILPYFDQATLAVNFRKATGNQKKAFQSIIDASYSQLTTKFNERNPVVFKFCYLGDIIDATIDTCISLYASDNEYLNSMLTNLKIVFGHVILPTLDKDGSPTSVKLNLNDLPISYNLFNAWFIRNVVDKGRLKFSIRDFIRKMIVELVTAAIGPNCMSKEDHFFARFPKSYPEVTFSTVRIPSGGGEIFTWADPTVPLSLIVDTSTVNNPTTSNTAVSSGPAEKNMFLKRMNGQRLKNINFSEAEPDDPDAILTNYMFINTRSFIATRKKNIEKDFSQGIFHFKIAQDDGMVKEIKFDRVEAGYLESALLTDTRNKTDIDQVRRIYNATIDMYGNSSFIPGQMIYIDPHTVGFGDPTKSGSLARRLGLGGYFIVTQVSNSISSGEFSTQLKCRWVSFGDGRKLPKGVKKKSLRIKGKCSPNSRQVLVQAWNQYCDEEYKLDHLPHYISTK